jgi:tetratricopeptide (TPR) repeat protein
MAISPTSPGTDLEAGKEMRRTPVVILTIALLAAPAGADTVRVGKLTYADVRVTGFSEGNLGFMVAANPVIKPISKITLIAVDNRETFNKAEQLRESDPVKAVGLYDAAARAAWNQWEKKLISYRRLDALGLAALSGRWAREWTELILGGEGAAVDLRPAKLGDESQVREAAAQLQRALKEAEETRVKVAILTVLEQLKAHDPSAASVDQTNGAGENEAEDGTEPSTGVEVKVSSESVGRLTDFEVMLTTGKAEQAVAEIDKFLKIAGERDLPRALFLGGVARLKVLRGRTSRQPLSQAGVMFMEVAVFYPGCADAAEALYRAGEVSERLGDAAGAGAAYREVGYRYPDSSFAKEAAKKLQALQAEATEATAEDKTAAEGP